MKGLTFDTPFGAVTFRALDHQSTMGAYVGRTAVNDGKGVMVDWRYANGKDYLPPDDVDQAAASGATDAVRDAASSGSQRAIARSIALARCPPRRLASLPAPATALPARRRCSSSPPV